MSDATRGLFDLVTALAWLMLAAAGIGLRCRRIVRLRRIVLLEPVDPRDAAYLASVMRSTCLRLLVKVVFMLGALVALFDLGWLWPAWRVGIVMVLVLMLIETVSVDAVRERLGRAVEAEA